MTSTHFPRVRLGILLNTKHRFLPTMIRYCANNNGFYMSSLMYGMPASNTASHKVRFHFVARNAFSLPVRRMRNLKLPEELESPVPRTVLDLYEKHIRTCIFLFFFFFFLTSGSPYWDSKRVENRNFTRLTFSKI